MADPPRPGEPGSDEALRDRVAELARLEDELAGAFPDAQPPHVAQLLEARWDASQSPQGWAPFFRSELVPEARRGLNSLVASVGGRLNPAQVLRLQAYQEMLNALLERLQNREHRADPGAAAVIRAAVQPHLSPTLQGESLSRMALDFVVSSPGVTCALNGMRDPAYVDDAVGVMELPPIPDVVAVARSLAR